MQQERNESESRQPAEDSQMDKGAREIPQLSADVDLDEALEEMDPMEYMERFAESVEAEEPISQDDVEVIIEVLDKGLEQNIEDVVGRFDQMLADKNSGELNELRETVKAQMTEEKEAALEKARRILESRENQKEGPKTFAEAFPGFRIFVEAVRENQMETQDLVERAIDVQDREYFEKEGFLIRLAFELDKTPEEIFEIIDNQPDPETRRFLLESFGIPQIEDGSEVPDIDSFVASEMEQIGKQINKKREEQEALLEGYFTEDEQKDFHLGSTRKNTNFDYLKDHFEDETKLRALEQIEMRENEIRDLESDSARYEKSRTVYIQEKRDEFTNPESTQETVNASESIAQNLSREKIELLQQELDETNDPTQKEYLSELIRAEEKRVESEKELLSKISGVEMLGEGKNRTLLLGFEGRDKPAIYKSALGEENIRSGIIDQGTYFKREWLAAQIDRTLGLDVVPPTILREDGPDGIGSVQSWEAGKSPADLSEKDENYNDDAMTRIALLDELVHNTDRHKRNLLVQPDGGVVAIDNALCLPRENLKLTEREKKYIEKYGDSDGSTDKDAWVRSKKTMSFPREYLIAKQKTELPEEIKNNLKRLINSSQLQETLKKAFMFALGEDDGQKQFKALKERIKVLVVANPNLTRPDIKKYHLVDTEVVQSQESGVEEGTIEEGTPTVGPSNAA
jgi:hypothetical protein